MKEQDRQRVIRQKVVRLEHLRGSTAGALPTGFSTLDEALGTGGLPRGRIIELYGPSASGKSTLAMRMVAHIMKTGASAAWIDAEHVFDPAQAAQFGVTTEKLPLARPDSAEQALEISRQLVESGALDLLVIDSAAALVPRLELETGLGESGHGLHSRVLGWGLRKLAAAAARSDAAILVLNQTRGLTKDGETAAGGPPLKLYAAVRIALDAARGNQVRFRIVKNKGGAAFTEGRLHWESGRMHSERP